MPSTSFRKQRFELHLLSKNYSVASWQGFECISQPWQLYLTLLLPGSENLANLLQQAAQFKINSKRCFSGIVFAVKHVEIMAENQQKIIITLVSRLFFLRNNSKPRVWVEKTIQFIIDEVLVQHGYLAQQLHWPLTKSKHKKSFICQIPGEDDWRFLQRICAGEGWFFFFATKGEQEHIYFCDNNSPQLGDCTKVYYHPTSGLVVQEKSVIYELIYGVASGSERLALIAKTFSSDFEVGGCIELVAEKYPLSVNGHYRVTRVVHAAKVEGLSDYAKGYHACLQLSPIVNKCARTKLLFLNLPGLLTAKIASKNKIPQLDAKGYYRLRFIFDLTSAKSEWASAQVPRLAPYGGAQTSQLKIGWHLPLYPGAEVAVGFIYGDPHQPIIIAALPNSNSSSVVKPSNKFENIQLSRKGNSWCFDDSEKMPGIFFHQPESANQLKMFSTGEKTSFCFLSNQGNFNFYAGTTIKITTAGGCKYTVGQAVTISSQKVTQLKTQKDIYYQSGKAINLFSKREGMVKGDSISYCAGGDINYIGEKAASILIESKHINLQSDQHRLAADKKIVINASKEICINQKMSAIHLSAGKIDIYGQRIALNCPGAVALAGEVNPFFVPGEPWISQSLPALMAVKKWQAITSDGHKSVSNLHWDRGWALIGDTVQACFDVHHFSDGETIVFAVYAIDGAQQILIDQQNSKIESAAGEKIIVWKYPDENISKKTKARSGKHGLVKFIFKVSAVGVMSEISQNHLCLLTTVIIQPAWLFGARTVAIENQAVIQLTLPFNAATIRFCDHDRLVKTFNHARVIDARAKLSHIPLGTAAGGAYQSDNNKNKLLSLEVLDPNYEHPSYQQSIKVKNLNKSGVKVKLSCLFPPIVCNIRNPVVQEKERDKQRFLSSQQIAYLKSCNNEAILFVHGYGVGIGDYGRYFSDIKIHSKQKIITQTKKIWAETVPTMARATVKRDYQSLKQEFSALREHKPPIQGLEDDVINGSGAYNWFVHMEYNINQALGFEGKDYRKYKRLVQVTWSGDPDLSIDYMHAVQQYPSAGERLFSLVKQLLDVKIKVQIIAHSLGNAVVLHCLQKLARGRFLYKNTLVDRVFLWNAAVPYNCLGKSSKQPDALWHFPRAHEAVRKIIVLYSKNDNILGPLLAKQPPGVAHNKVIAMKPFWQELLPAEILTHLGLHSLYCVANWAGISINELFQQQNQKNIYQHWIKYHPVDKNGREFPNNFHDQIIQDRSCNERLYKVLLDKLIKTQSYVNQDLIAVHRPYFASLMSTAEILLRYGYLIGWLEDSLVTKTHSFSMAINLIDNKPAICGAQTLINTFFLQTPYRPTEALGYCGPDRSDPLIEQLIRERKLLVVDQTRWLYSHSGMKVPSPEVVAHIYRLIGKDLNATV